jgi:hypothetical protein
MAEAISGRVRATGEAQMTAWGWSAPLWIGPVRSGPISAVATAQLVDDRTLIISCDNDGVMRRWNAATRQPVGDALTGHTSEVQAVVSARLEDGRTLIVSGGDDGVLRRWNAAPGEPVGDALTGHTGWVWTVASARLDDGRTLIISGGDDGVLRRWNAATGEPVGDPLTGDNRPVLAVVSARLEDGRTLIVSPYRFAGCLTDWITRRAWTARSLKSCLVCRVSSACTRGTSFTCRARTDCKPATPEMAFRASITVSGSPALAWSVARRISASTLSRLATPSYSHLRTEEITIFSARSSLPSFQ